MKKRYWLIGAGIGIILYLADVLISGFRNSIVFTPLFSSINDTFRQFGVSEPHENIFFTPALFVGALITYVLPFIILGWLYGKIKNKKVV